MPSRSSRRDSIVSTGPPIERSREIGVTCHLRLSSFRITFALFLGDFGRCCRTVALSNSNPATRRLAVQGVTQGAATERSVPPGASLFAADPGCWFGSTAQSIAPLRIRPPPALLWGGCCATPPPPFLSRPLITVSLLPPMIRFRHHAAMAGAATGASIALHAVVFPSMDKVRNL